MDAGKLVVTRGRMTGGRDLVFIRIREIRAIFKAWYQYCSAGYRSVMVQRLPRRQDTGKFPLSVSSVLFNVSVFVGHCERVVRKTVCTSKISVTKLSEIEDGSITSSECLEAWRAFAQ